LSVGCPKPAGRLKNVGNFARFFAVCVQGGRGQKWEEVLHFAFFFGIGKYHTCGLEKYHSVKVCHGKYVAKECHIKSYYYETFVNYPHS